LLLVADRVLLLHASVRPVAVPPRARPLGSSGAAACREDAVRGSQSSTTWSHTGGAVWPPTAWISPKELDFKTVRENAWGVAPAPPPSPVAAPEPPRLRALLMSLARSGAGDGGRVVGSSDRGAPDLSDGRGQEACMHGVSSKPLRCIAELGRQGEP
jgi:hypothetical protein